MPGCYVADASACCSNLKHFKHTVIYYILVTQSSRSRKKNEVVRLCDEGEREGHRENNARCGHTYKKNRTDKAKMDRCV